MILSWGQQVHNLPGQLILWTALTNVSWLHYTVSGFPIPCLPDALTQALALRLLISHAPVAAFAPLLFLCGVLESSHPFCALITSKILILGLDLLPEFQGYLSYSLMVRSSRLPHVSSSMSVTGLIITFQPLPAPCHLSRLHLYPGFVLKWFPSLKPQAPLCLLPLSHLPDTKCC